MKLKIGRLSPGEKIFLYRRREGRSQVKMAEIMGIGVGNYKMMEKGEKPLPQSWLPENIISETLRPNEKCIILRRRSQPPVTQEEIAEKIGCCRNWVVLMEKGTVDCEELVKYWSRKQ